MLEIFKAAVEIVRQQRQLKRDIRRLEAANLDYEALQRIVEEVANKNVVIEIKNEKDGYSSTITIKPKPINQIEFKSFDQKYNEAMMARNI